MAQRHLAAPAAPLLALCWLLGATPLPAAAPRPRVEPQALVGAGAGGGVGAGGARVSFDTLTLVGERWSGGTWGKLDATGTQIPGTCGDAGSKPCTRGEPGVTALSCARSSAQILVLSPTAVVSMANDTAQISSDGGVSWSRYPGEDRADIYEPLIPAPAWLKASSGAAFMDVRPADAYVTSCTTPASCAPASPVTAAKDRVYLDWKLSPTGVPVREFAYGRSRGANSWSVPQPVSFFCTTCGGGVQLPDGSYVFLVALQYTDPRAGPDGCCNNSVRETPAPLPPPRLCAASRLCGFLLAAHC